MRAWVEEMEAVPLMLGMVVPMGFVVIVKFIERCAPVVCGWLYVIGVGVVFCLVNLLGVGATQSLIMMGLVWYDNVLLVWVVGCLLLVGFRISSQSHGQ